MLIDRYSNDKEVARALFLLIAPLGMQSKEVEAEAMRMVDHSRPLLEIAHYLAGIELTLRAVHGEELPAPAPRKEEKPTSTLDSIKESIALQVRASVDEQFRAKGALANTRPAASKKLSDAG